MTGQFGTTTETMEAASRHVLDVNTEVQTELSSLKNRLGAVQGAWVGEAKTAFDTLMVRWDEDARKLNEALSAIGENIRTNSVNYSATQADHVSAINNAGGSLNL